MQMRTASCVLPFKGFGFNVSQLDLAFYYRLFLDPLKFGKLPSVVGLVRRLFIFFSMLNIIKCLFFPSVVMIMCFPTLICEVVNHSN